MIMMMIGQSPPRSNPTIEIPAWDPYDEPRTPFSPFNDGYANASPNSPFLDSLTALHRYLPSNDSSDSFNDEQDLAVDAFSCDHFRIYEFKVRRCARGRSHDWTECPYAHPGEKARRRDPRRCHYSGTACPDYRKGGCRKGDSCEFAHGVFECWLHPARYRTQPCKDGPDCRRRVCFFAHTPEQLRVLPHQTSPGDGSGYGEAEAGSGPGSSLFRRHFDSYFTKARSFGSSPTSILASPPMSPPSESPPVSPSGQVVGGSFNSMAELLASVRGLQLGGSKMRGGGSGCSWNVQSGSAFVSPRGSSSLRPSFSSVPSTPTRAVTHSGLAQVDFWEGACVEEPAMERVESGRNLRAKMYAKLSKENSLGQADSSQSAPDVAWVSELVK